MDTMSISEVNQSAAPSTTNSGCNNAYVDSEQPLAGGTLTGNLIPGSTNEMIKVKHFAPLTRYITSRTSALNFHQLVELSLSISLSIPLGNNC